MTHGTQMSSFSFTTAGHRRPSEQSTGEDGGRPRHGSEGESPEELPGRGAAGPREAPSREQGHGGALRGAGRQTTGGQATPGEHPGAR
jgi:hypothetical protein